MKRWFIVLALLIGACAYQGPETNRLSSRDPDTYWVIDGDDLIGRIRLIEVEGVPCIVFQGAGSNGPGAGLSCDWSQR